MKGSIVTMLKEACAASGLNPDERDSAIATYLLDIGWWIEYDAYDELLIAGIDI